MPVRQGVRSPYLTSSVPKALATAPASPPRDDDRTALIDNSRNIYLRVRLRCGVILMCRPEVFWLCPQVLQVLYSDVGDILALLPRNLRPLLQRTKIFVNHEYAYGLKSKPQRVQHTTAHHHHEWLLWARDRPDKVMSIEIYNAGDFCRMRQHWNGCGLLLHEYCHVIHQHVLGLQNQRIIDLYEDACRSGRYDRTLRRDWAGKEDDHDMHYCMVDHKEFFAEISVTYLAQGYKHLDRADTSQLETCSPPIMEPIVRQRLRNYKGRLLDPIPPREGHCNKFQPFTSGWVQHACE
uniref:Uncharacterized protein n=1 Tax=Amphora coffeiformis TaxID=265554 RepID=A0A7S3KWZ5_9STRA